MLLCCCRICCRRASVCGQGGVFRHVIAAVFAAAVQVFVPKAVCDVIDSCIQMHGAAGLSDDFMLARAYAGMRGLRIADGPDEVHLRTIGQLEVKKFKAKL